MTLGQCVEQLGVALDGMEDRSPAIDVQIRDALDLIHEALVHIAERTGERD